MSRFQMNEMKCCIPGCKANLSEPHLAYYTVKPQWLSSIIIHIYTKEEIAANKNSIRLRTNLICAVHYSLCNIRESCIESTINFPYLRMSVNKTPTKSKFKRKAEKVCHEVQLYQSDEISVGREEEFPVYRSAKVGTIREKKVSSPKYPQSRDHNYALTADYINFMKHNYEKICNDNAELTQRHLSVLNTNNSEISRLKCINHELLWTQLHLGKNLRSAVDNEAMLKFYTGFADRENFMRFLDKVRPLYVAASDFRPPNVDMCEQILIVLTRLRLRLSHQDLSYRCAISLAQIHKICAFWTKLFKGMYEAKSRGNNRVIIELVETLLELDVRDKIYGRCKALIEISESGSIGFMSDLFSIKVDDKYIIEKSPKNKHWNGEPVKNSPFVRLPLQIHTQRILGFLKGFQVLKGSFPNSICSLEQLNTLWKICGVLVDYMGKQANCDEKNI